MRGVWKTDLVTDDQSVVAEWVKERHGLYAKDWFLDPLYLRSPAPTTTPEPVSVDKDDEGRPYPCGAFVWGDARWFCRLESDHAGAHEWAQRKSEPDPAGIDDVEMLRTIARHFDTGADNHERTGPLSVWADRLADRLERESEPEQGEPVGMCIGSYSRGPDAEDLLLVRPSPGVTVPQPIGTKLFVRPQQSDEVERLQDYVGLHESVEITYVVDGYEATLTTHDGASKKASAKGHTITAALTALSRALDREIVVQAIREFADYHRSKR
jgi:hypothetical protein